MRNIRNSLAWAALGLVAVLSACSDSGSTSPTPEPNGNEGIVIKDEVRVLDESARESLEAFDLDLESGAGELRFQVGDPSIAAFEVGQILVTEPVLGVAPHGFLQRIKGKREEGGEIVFTTEQATLEDVFEEAIIDYFQTLTADDLVSTTAHYEGIRFELPNVAGAVSEKKVGYEFAVDFDKVLVDLDGDHETKDDQLRIDGKFKFNAGAEAKIDIGWTGLKHFKFLLHVSEEADVTLTGALKKEFEKQIEVASYSFGTFTVMVGIVPVVFAIDMELSVGASGKLEAHLVVKAAQSAGLKLGAEYKDGKWANLSGFDSNFDFPTPDITAKASARGYVRPQLGISIYGLAGPYAFAQAFVEADAEYKRDPFWTVDAGLDFGMGLVVKLPVVGKLADWHDSFEALRKKLGDSPNEKPVLELISPADGVRLEDGDTLTFDIRASDREQEKVDVVLSEGGKEIAKVSASEGKVEKLVTEPLCQGSYTFDIVAKDDKGATDQRKISAVVANYKPRVTLDGDHLDDLPIFPGSYLVAFANASDRSCEAPGNTAEQDLIEWYLNDEKLAATGKELLHRLPTGASMVGQNFTLEARYSDGKDTGISNTAEFTIGERPAGVDLPPVAVIRKPSADSCADQQELLVNVSYSLEGLGVDTEDGKLAPISWEFKALEYGTDFTLPGTATQFKLNGPGSWEVTMKVQDSAGQTDTKTVTICSTVAG